jgi:hypothetical protein
MIFSQEFQSPVRKSRRTKIQTTHYGHDSPGLVSPQSRTIAKESPELDNTE